MANLITHHSHIIDWLVRNHEQVDGAFVRELIMFDGVRVSEHDVRAVALIHAQQPLPENLIFGFHLMRLLLELGDALRRVNVNGQRVAGHVLHVEREGRGGGGRGVGHC